MTRTRFPILTILPLLLGCLLATATTATAQVDVATHEGHRVKPGELIVVYQGVTPSNLRARAHADINALVRERFEIIDADVVRLPADLSISQAIEWYEAQPGVKYAVPNYIRTLVGKKRSLSNDPRLNDQWHLHNTGQGGGTSDADIDAPEAWNKRTDASSIIVGIIDTGVDYNHPDLKDNMWVNLAEKNGRQGVDDDGNGYVDDVYGWDWGNNDNDPMDVEGHGTHVAGIVGASGNNSRGVSGVAWRVKIMALKFFANNGDGTDADAIRAIQYARRMGAHLTNNSWGGDAPNQALRDAIEANGRPFVVASGNMGRNNDNRPDYPGNFPSSNIIVVAATNNKDRLTNWSNYGARNVDLGAPGEGILSTISGNRYEAWDGTSMAAPVVAGVIALVLAEQPGLSAQAVINRVMSTGDSLSTLAGTTVSGKRVNLQRALTGSGGDDGGGGGGGATGRLRVRLNPFDARTDGAQWTYDGAGQWFNHNQTAQNVPVGVRRVSFKSVSGWQAPGERNVTVEEGRRTTIGVTYTEVDEVQTGSVRVTIAPQDAVQEGARWALNNQTTWRNSGATIGALPVGTHTIRFRDIPGWQTPGQRSITVTANQTATTHGVYVEETGGGGGGGTNQWPGPDGGGYTGTSESGGFEDITFSGNDVWMWDWDEGRRRVDIPFQFPFYGQHHGQVYVYANGYLTFTPELSEFIDMDMPAAEAPYGIIAPYWTDLTHDRLGWITWEVRGSGDSRRLIIQWETEHWELAEPGSSHRPVIFQAKLFADGTIVFAYRDVTTGVSGYDNGRTVTVGIQNPGGNTALEYSHDGARGLRDGQKLVIRPR